MSIYFLSFLSRTFFPACLDDLGIDRRFFHNPAGAAELDRRDKSTTRTAERLEREVTTLGEYLYVGNENFQRFRTEDHSFSRRLLVCNSSSSGSPLSMTLPPVPTSATSCLLKNLYLAENPCTRSGTLHTMVLR